MTDSENKEPVERGLSDWITARSMASRPARIIMA